MENFRKKKCFKTEIKYEKNSRIMRIFSFRYNIYKNTKIKESMKSYKKRLYKKRKYKFFIERTYEI